MAAAKLHEKLTGQTKEFIGERLWKEAAKLDKSAKRTHVYLARDTKNTPKYVGVSAPKDGQEDKGPIPRSNKHCIEVSLATVNIGPMTRKEAVFAELFAKDGFIEIIYSAESLLKTLLFYGTCFKLLPFHSVKLLYQ
uniref:Ribosomal_L18e/L15P domain-containing protein n=1 Tax=Rhabditophanes sp. KR3021 TaxID=114890 RepID=A0AC35TN01_9BILA